jgi:hypothetical protein
VERAGRDEEHVVGLDEPYFVLTDVSLDDRQEIALHALARDVGPRRPTRAGDLVDLVEKHDARGLRALDASRATWPGSIEAPFSSACRIWRASPTVALRRFFLPPKRPGSISLTLMSISSTPWLVTISKDGNVLSATSTPPCVLELAVAQQHPELARVSSASRVRQGGQEQVEQPLLGARSARGRGSRSVFSSRTIWTATSVRSRTIDSTSRPT